MKIAIVDFDKTLITVDSLVEIIFRQKFFYDLKLMWSFFLLAVAIFIARGNKQKQIAARSKVKKRLAYLFKTNEDRINIQDIPYLKTKLNLSVLSDLKSKSYDKIIVASASFEELIYNVCNNEIQLDKIVASKTNYTCKNYVTCWNSVKIWELEACIPDIWENEITVYTDSLDDAPLISKAKQVFWVDGENINA